MFAWKLVSGGGRVVVYNQYANLAIDQQRQRLPIFSYRNHILYLLETNQVIVKSADNIIPC